MNACKAQHPGTPSPPLLDKARRAAPGLDIYVLYDEWRNYMECGEILTPGSATATKAQADLTDTRLPEIRRFLKGNPDIDRTGELSTLMRTAGLPI